MTRLLSMRSAIVGAAAALLAGCATGPDYHAPTLAALKVPEQFATGARETSADADLARWWRAFDDPILTALVERGLAANLDIDEAGSRVRAARADLRAARGALLPSLDAFGSGTRQVGERTSGQTSGRASYQIGFDAAYETDIFGGGRRSVEAARATAEGTRANLRAVQLTVAAEIALNYLDAREAQAAAAHTRAAAQDAPVGILERPVPLPRHDSVLDAAASKAVGIANKSARAEAVALWLTRLAGGASRTDFVAALEKAGLDRDRSEAEVVRMLAMDILFEPKAGFYRVLQN